MDHEMSINEEQIADDTYRWTHTDTLAFLDLYEIYRKQVGSLRLKNLKKMYEEISLQLRHKNGKNISPNNCENRWRVLERAYKKYLINMNKTGAARKDFEYAEIMNNILGKKKSIVPEILLASATIDDLILEIPADDVAVANAEENGAALSSSAGGVDVQAKKPQATPSITKVYRNKKLKSNLLQEIRNDRKEYYKKRLEQEERKLEEKVKKTKLLEERNEILKHIRDRAVLVAELDE